MKKNSIPVKSGYKKNNISGKEITGKGVSKDQLHDLLKEGLKDLYWAEKALTRAIPKMIKNTSSPDLLEALTGHLEETTNQITRLEEVFTAIGEKPIAKKCPAMEGLIKEAGEIMDEAEEGVMMDAGIIAAAQKVEHYEIASYGTLRAYAELLGHDKAAELLQETLDEEKAADEKLSAITPRAVLVAEGEEDV